MAPKGGPNDRDTKGPDLNETHSTTGLWYIAGLLALLLGIVAMIFLMS
ncbi:hypothetical protein [Halorussus halophilus]|nr:hypothetical protein [Halorussus halophilus]